MDFRSFLLSIFVLMFWSINISASIFDPARDFSTTENPTGAWRYGYTNHLGGLFNIYVSSNSAFYGADTWNRGFTTYPDMYPNVYYNSSITPIDYGSGSIQPGEIGFHPGNDGSFSVIRWTAPYDGDFLVDVTFLRDESSSTYGITDVHVLNNNNSLFDAMLNATTNKSSFSDTMFFSFGTTVDFVVGYGEDYVFYGDTVDLKALISPVPIPSPALLFCLV